MHSHRARHRARHWVVLAGTLLLALTSACTAGERDVSAPKRRRPNIVFILLDDVRYDDMVDHPFVDLPNLKRLATERASFHRCCRTPATTPASSGNGTWGMRMILRGRASTDG